MNREGLKVIKGGKHSKIIPFGDARYTLAMSSTPSDRNAGSNVARDIIKAIY
jgi:hypothetical protein